jgi:hypothetical protein
MRRIIILCGAMLIASLLSAQKSSLYMPPVFQKAYEKGTRSWDGNPGPNYWQNSAKYNIKAEYDPVTKLISGKETILYKNNSRDTIPYLITKFLQNIYKKGSTRDNDIPAELLTDGITIGKFAVNGKTYYKDNEPFLEDIPPYFVQEYGTNLIVVLRDNPIKPGDELTIEAEWELTLPPTSLVRTGYFDSTSFFAGYWYPQVSVYDDISGFDIQSYTGIQETYNDINEYEVEITLPSDYLVWATGEQQNEEEVYSKAIMKRINESKESDELMKIVEKEDWKKGPVSGEGKKTWKFKASNVPDFAWGASDHFLWDATSLEVDKSTGRRVWIHSVYPDNENDYSDIIGYCQEGIDFLSNDFPGVPFPYPKHITIHTLHAGGMEFPMMANNNFFADTAMCYDVTVHEIAHTYFPFYVCINERQYAWMDEGWVTIFGHLSLKAEGYSRDQWFMEPTSMYSRMSRDLNNTPLMVPSSQLSFATMTNHYYVRPVQAQFLLLDIMKELGVDNPLPEYIKRWNGKHPTPYDFFFTMDDIAGQDLAWFWKPWYFEFGVPDLAVKEVKENGKQVEITVEKVGDQPVPIHLEITYDENLVENETASILVWKDGRKEHTITIETDVKPLKVVVGSPEVPDVDRSNNTWKN